MVSSMNEMSLSALYRRLTSNGAAPSVEAEEIVAAVDGTLQDERRDRIAERLSASAPHAALAHVLRDLHSDSEQFAADVARTHRNAAHRRHARDERRTGTGRRFGGVTRWAAAAAACLVAALGVWTQHHEGSPAVAPATPSVAHRGDVIFSSRDRIFADMSDAHVTKTNRGDELFRGSFNG
jgi:hypothetical protein